jgi:SAM-dependent methyltransferase
MTPSSETSLGNRFAVDDSLIELVVTPHIRQEFEICDPAWRERSAQEISGRTLGRRQWLRRMVFMGRNAAQQTDVRKAYESHWTSAESLEQYVEGLNGRSLAIEWRQRGLIASPQILRQVHILYIMNAIEAIDARKVLEVGCGNGHAILTLAARFPQVSFSGVELTASGVKVAQAAQKLAELPSGIASNSPLPARDLSAHQRIDLRVGDARALPYSDRSFDLVYTRLALEQMEQIREQALHEIARVADRAIVLIEPWRDYNVSKHARTYIRRAGYFKGKIKHLEKLGFRVAFETKDIPQKVQFNAGPVVAIRR